MSEYIERGALMQAITAFFEPVNTAEQALMLNHTLKAINLFPAADVVEVKHGEWDNTGRYKFPGGSVAVRCSECGCCLTAGEYRMNVWNYCPVCGARMDGGADNVE